MSEEFEVEQVEVEAEAVAEPVEVAVEVEAEAEAVVEPEVEAPVKTSSRKPKAAVEVESVDVVAPVVEAEPVPANAVHMKALVYTATRKNSQSVTILQKRLADCGYKAARADLPGWFHDNTRAALSKWQEEQGLDVTGTAEFEDMRYLFDGTDVVLVP